MHQGSCLCGGVRYELDAPITEISVCHCRMCRKASGTAFVAVAPVAADKFRLTAGLGLIKAYESSPGKKRWFCAVCASPLYSETAYRPGMVRVRIGTLDTAPGTSRTTTSTSPTRPTGMRFMTAGRSIRRIFRSPRLESPPRDYR